MNTTRLKRGLLDFVGTISHELFGIATDKSVNEIKTMLKQTHAKQGQIIHQVNNVISVINHTYDEVQMNRDEINKLQSFVRVSTTLMKRFFKNYTKSAERWNNVEAILSVERAVISLELSYAEYVSMMSIFRRQKQALESERLTVDLLSEEQLSEILQRETRNNIVRIEPLQWYYEFCRTEPLWDSDMLVYRVKLPLIDNYVFIMYQLHSWPVSYNLSGIYTKIQVNSIIAVDTMSGYTFQPKNCIGNKPRVCFNNVKYKNAFKCEMAIIKGDDKGNENYIVSLIRSKPKTIVKEITTGEYILSTPGEEIIMRCLYKSAQSYKLKAGVYAIDVEKDCIYEGKTWIITPLLEANGRISIMALKINTNPVRVHQILENHLEAFNLNESELSPISEVKRVFLKPLNEVEVATDISNDFELSNVDILIIIVMVLRLNGKDT